MAVAERPFLAAVLLLVSSGLLCSFPLPACPEPCTCQRAPLLNCSSSGLSVVPQHIQDTVTELDLSYNLIDSVTLDRPLHNLRNVWLGNNSITRLSLCIERNLGGRHVRGRNLHRLRPWSRRGCVSWAPSLQLLSVERNQLEQLPEGLEGSESLQVLQLSFNKISTLRPGDLSHLQQLIELHLQHNLITSLHPQMFQDLAQLRVLDLSFNKLTSLHPLMYLSLRNIGADVRLSGNRWQCDCSMRSLRRRLVFDRSRGLEAWSVVCTSPSSLSGRDLLQLEEDDLNCFHTENRPELHQDVTVYSGSEILLTCSTQDSMWLTPSGHASVSQPQAGLLINDITEKDTGLYVCVSEKHEVVSVFNLQISKIEGTRRKTRSLDRTSQQIIPQGIPNRIGQQRNQTGNSEITQSDFNLAVCLSVFITFLIAFISGVLARPCIDVLCRKVTNKRSTTQTNTVSSVEQRQYDNGAYYNYEEPEETGVYRERGIDVSTGDLRENSNVQYYDTVATDNQVKISNDAVKDTHAGGDSSSENSLQRSSPEEDQRDARELSGIANAGRTHNIESEHIPGSVKLEKRRSSSSSSDSSQSDRVFNDKQKTQRDHTTPKSPQLVKDSVQQRADVLTARNVQVPQISKEGSEIPGFSSEPFADWSPHTKNPNLTDPDLWQENEEQFEFSDSVRSVSARSSGVFDSFNDSKLTAAPTSNKKMRDDMSSSSGDEPTEYTANSGDYRNDTQRHAIRPKHSFSSHSSDSDGKNRRIKRETIKGSEKGNSIHVSDKLNNTRVTGEADTRKKVVPKQNTKWRLPSLGLGFTSRSKSIATGGPAPSAASSSSSSSESESEVKTRDLQVGQKRDRLSAGNKISEPEKLSTHQSNPKVKWGLDINAPLQASKSTSSDESIDDKTKHTKRQEQKDVDKERSPAFKVTSPASGSSPSSDSENETQNQKKKQEQRETNMAKLPTKVSQVKRPLDIKPSSPHSDSSSSSDSGDEKQNQKKKQEQRETNMAKLPTKVSQTVSHDPQTQWPAIDLEHNTSIKRRLDFKVTSPASDSSSSSDSENETPNQMKKQEQRETNMARLPTKVSQIKRPLDIKPPSPHSDSSSSSDSEDETTSHLEKQRPGKVEITGLPFQGSKIQSPGSYSRWPALDLKHTMRIKRRLDFKIASPASDSSSSSDSENETQNQMKKQEQRETNMAKLPTTVSQIKRPLDIKAQSPHSDSSSSSDSENETQNQKKKQEQRETNMAKPLTTVSQVRRPPEIKAQSPHSDSSSSSDSENETQNQKKKQEQRETNMAKPLTTVSQVRRPPEIKAQSPHSDSSSSSDSENETQNQKKKQEQRETNMAKLPTKISQVKKPLDIKARSPHSDSSSSSDSEDEKTNHTEKQRPGKVEITGLPFQGSKIQSPGSYSRWPALDLERTTRIKRRLDFKITSPASDSSSSSDSEDDTPNQMKKQEHRETNMARLPINISQIKRPLDTKPSSPHSDSSSSSDSENETQNQKKKQEQRETNMSKLPTTVYQIKRPLEIKAQSPHSDSSSSSDSEDETSHTEKQRPGKVEITGLPFQGSKIQSPGSYSRWPALDLERTTLDFKVTSPASDSSSSSDSEDDTPNQKKKQEHREASMARLPTTVSQVKRPLDIKPSSPHSDSSSSSDSGDEKQNQKKKQEQRETNMAKLPTKVSQTVSHDPQTQWPAVDLEHNKRNKRRLDFKVTSPASDSSSSSDSEKETQNHIKKQEQRETNTAKLPTKVFQIKRPLDIKPPSPHSDSSSSSDSENETPNQMKKQEQREKNMARLPTKVSQIKRPLDIKPPSPHSDSSSSSDSEKETQNHIKKQEQRETNMAKLPTKVSQIKRPLDIKPPSPLSDSSSSSDSENETPNQMKKQEQRETNMAKLPTTVSQIKRPLDIKPPSPHSDSSSSSDSEDDPTHHTKREKPQLVEVAGLLFRESQTVSHDPETRWPVVDLGNITRIKRRLDIKALSPPLDSSLSGGGTNHTVEVKREEAIENSSPYSSSSSDEQEEGREELSKPSTTVEPNLGSRWPQLSLSSAPHVKRHLDIRAHSPPLESSSSSNESEGATPDLSLKVERGRADVGIPSYQPRTKLPDLNMSIPLVKRTKRESSASPGSKQSESNSSGSDSEAENRDHEKQRLGSSTISKPKKKEFISSSKTSMIRTSSNPNIKLEKYTVFTDNVGDTKISDNFNTTPEISPELESRWAKMSLNMSRFRKRLEITPRTQKPSSLPSSPKIDSSSSSSSEEGTGSKSSKTSYKRRGTESSQIPENKLVNVSLSLKGQDDNTGNSVEVKQGIRKDYGLPITKEKSNPDTMLTGFGTSHLRRHLDIKVSEKAQATPPLQQLSDSSSSSENEDALTEHAGKGWQGRSQLPVVLDNNASQIHTSLHVAKAANIKMDYSQSQTEAEERKARVELKSQTSKVGEESDSVRSHMSLPHIPLQRKVSSSSNSEDEMIGDRVSKLNLGVPSDKKHLNVKAPLTSSSSSSSSSSENENEVKGYTAKQSRHATDMPRMTDESLITYKRSIFKTSSTPSKYYSHNGPTIDYTNQRLGAEMVNVAQEGPSHSVRGSNASLASRSMSFDDVVKKRIDQSKHTTDVDLPPEIRWTGVGRQLSDLSISSQRRHLDVGLSTPPAEPDLPQFYPSNYSAGKSDNKIKQDRVTLMHKYSSLRDNSVSLASTRALDQFDYSSGSTNEISKAVHEDGRERKGLKALKVMSSERRMWDTQNENLDKGASPFDVHGSQVNTSFNYQRSEDIKPLAKQSLTQLHLSSTSVDERRGTNLFYGVPHYRRHVLGGTGPMQESPPPIPKTPLPDEAVGLTWRSLQSSKKQGLEGTRSFFQQSRNTGESSSTVSQNQAVHFDSSNISHV